MSTRDLGSRARRRGPAPGFTVLETVISVVVIVVVLQAITSSTMLLSRGSSFGREKSRVMARAELAMEKLGNELRLSSRADNPLTGEPMLEVLGEEGSEQIRFRRVVDFGDNGSELLPIWSSPIVYAVEDEVLLRTQDDRREVIVRGIESLDFDLDLVGRVLVQFDLRLEGTTEQTRVLTHRFHVTPKF
jgi:hypothetical protein